MKFIESLIFTENKASRQVTRRCTYFDDLVCLKENTEVNDLEHDVLRDEGKVV